MNLDIIKERDTPLLSRKRVTIKADYEGATPSRKDFRKGIADKLKVDEKLVIIKHIYTRFGMKKSKVIAHVYSNIEDLNNFEDSAIIKRHQPKKKEGEEAEGGEAPAEEKSE